MTRFLLPLGGFALLVVVLIVGLKHAPEKNIIPSPLIGKSAPQFQLHNLFNGQSPVSAVALRGRWSLVNVWGTWCGECRAEHQALLQIKQEGQVPIIGIDWKDQDEEAQEWLTQLGNPYEMVGTDHDGRVAIDWGVYGAPESFLVNPSGTIVYKHIGALSAEIWQQRFLPLIRGRYVAPAASSTGAGA
jgi:cytochrome c biogenesis protein CcmG, thiol:disulfide interchange protein DsbE